MGNVRLTMDSAALREVIQELDLEDRLPNVAPRALEAGAQVLLPYIQARAPVRTGQLKKAMAVTKRRRAKGHYSVDVGAPGHRAPHGHLVEQGHGGPKPAPAHPFMAPAAAEAEEAVMSAIMKELTAAL